MFTQFTQKCFIRKNTPGLVRKLEILGGRNGCVFFHEKYNIVSASPYFFRCIRNDMVDSLIKDAYIDCGTNDELFLAIASLRDDSDSMQWFVHKDGYFIFCDQSELKHVIDNNDECMDYCVADFNKATVQELIEHFKP